MQLLLPRDLLLVCVEGSDDRLTGDESSVIHAHYGMEQILSESHSSFVGRSLSLDDTDKIRF